MSIETAFVGDVHGNVDAFRAMNDVLQAEGGPHIVFLGDYVNKGPRSAEVLEELLLLHDAGTATVLKGNHEVALLDALETGDLTTLIKMGGAVTVRSYVGRHVAPDVAADFRSSFPREHLEFLRSMSESYETDNLVARHLPGSDQSNRFSITAHRPIGEAPLINERSAQLDTGCGGERGRLTALLWPSLAYVQVDARGDVVSRAGR